MKPIFASSLQAETPTQKQDQPATDTLSLAIFDILLRHSDHHSRAFLPKNLGEVKFLD